jgi:hypothetical protein
LVVFVVNVTDWFPLFFVRNHAQLLFERLAHLNPVEHIEICDELFRFEHFFCTNDYISGFCAVSFMQIYFLVMQND